MLLYPIDPMYADVLVEIHKTSFDFPWTKEAFLDLLHLSTTIGWFDENAFILCSQMHDEMEILTLCVLPQMRQKGYGKILMKRLLKYAQESGIKKIFLEVSVTNPIAQHLYFEMGFREIGRRRNYYRTKDGFCDALCLEKKVCVE